MTETPIGERVATVEAELRNLREDVNDRVRKHAHMALDRSQEAVLRLDAGDEERIQMKQALAAQSQLLTDANLPELTRTVQKHSAQLSAMALDGEKQKTDFGWVMRILTFVLMAAMAIGQGALIMIVRDALAKPAPSPITSPAKKFP